MENFKAVISFKFQYVISQLNKYRKDNPLQVKLTVVEKGDRLWLTLHDGKATRSISFPIPLRDNYDNLVIGQRVTRAVGTWMHKDTEYNYWELMTWLLTGRIESAFPSAGRRNQLERLIQSFSGKDPMAFRSFQELIDGQVNRLPLTGTPMETWGMCNRVVILDPEFDSLTPQAALEYQKEVNIKHFPWTSVGLSDSGMCNNNLLKVDLREYTPFGLRHHNPMRNLYQTLGMKGDESPLVLTKSAARLAALGTERRGWNLTTCFLDVPLTFEDQLVVDVRHLDKFTLECRRFICFGDVQVTAGEELEEGATLSLEPNGKPLQLWTKTDRSLVVDVVKDVIPFNAREREVTVVYVETKHVFKEGIKLTNRHGNKGVVSFADCGMMMDSGTGDIVPIDLIVSAKTIGKRKNYGQVLEALLTLANGGRKMVIPDEAEVTLPQVKKFLAGRGYAEDGTSFVTTPWGEFRAICGQVFWGLIKNPENQLWTKADTEVTDGRNLRKAGVKLSHIEIKGLTTILGPQNPVIEEILSYQQGFNDVCEMVDILEVLRGKPMTKPVLHWSAIKPLLQTKGYFHKQVELSGTIIDENLLPEGFMLELPVIYHVFTPDKEKEEVQYQVLPLDTEDFRAAALAGGTNIFVNKILVPNSSLRSSWQHPTGTWGLSDIGGFLNNIIVACYRLEEEDSVDPLLRALARYFSSTAKRLSTKNGEIATYALAVRYPHSAKATATLAKEGLPQNWLEIHEEMAADLGVGTGDHVVAERFPCLGFKSLRIQRVRVTDDPQCRFVIRVSGNSLVSQNLDFDGDVLFLMSFKTPEANDALGQEFLIPDPLRKAYIDEANNQKQPSTQTLNLDEVGLSYFEPLTPQRQAEIVEGLTGVKRGTGTTVALCYNVMRIIEGNVGYEDQDTNLAIEVIMDMVANSVFAQKHDGESLEARCKRAICTADIDDMLAMGFPEAGSKKLCEVIRKEAKSVGVKNLERHYEKHLKRGTSNVINTIVRTKHRFYFATRASLEAVRLLQHLDGKPTDLTSHMWSRSKKIRETKADGDM